MIIAQKCTLHALSTATCKLRWLQHRPDSAYVHLYIANINKCWEVGGLTFFVHFLQKCTKNDCKENMYHITLYIFFTKKCIK